MLTFIETILHEAEAGNFSFFILTVDLILVAIGIANLYKKTR